MPNLEFFTIDRRFGLKINAAQTTKMLNMCGRSIPNETGGILLGRYSNDFDCAVITLISKAPPDSSSGRTWFRRGKRGLQRIIDRMWIRKQGYYLGEWHFHPFGTPSPSPIDIDQMKEISESEVYQCREPILLIIGGSPPEKWNARAFVFPRQESHLEMIMRAR